MNCGEAINNLLKAYGVDTIFGIPGTHTLELCRGLAGSGIRYVLARHEFGAALMADGYARASGRPGVVQVISGPGVTNALTGIGHAYADSVPLLLLSSDARSSSLKKGWGCLHEVDDLTALTSHLTGFSASSSCPQDIPELFGRAFALFASERPRPVHISVPLDILELPVDEQWRPRSAPARPVAHPDQIGAAAGLLTGAERPLICVGGGAAEAANPPTRLAERLGAVVVSSNAGKGVVPDGHPLNLGGSTVRPEARSCMSRADVILAVGTELSESDSFVDTMELPGKLIRIDLDPRMMSGLYPADVALMSDATSAIEAILAAAGANQPRARAEDEVRMVRAEIGGALTDSETQHVKALDVLRRVLPKDTIVMGDACQLVYTGAFSFPVSRPRQWHYPTGYCSLGPALPNAIGAKLAQPERPVAAIAGDGGFMFSVQELVTGAEQKLGIPIVIWNNGGFKEIQDGMNGRSISLVGVEGINPDFVALAKACHCHGMQCRSGDELAQAVGDAFETDRPTVIEITENDAWLQES